MSDSLDGLFAHLIEGRPPVSGGAGGFRGGDGSIGTEDMRRSFFGDFMDTEAEEQGLRKYGEIVDIPRWVKG